MAKKSKKEKKKQKKRVARNLKVLFAAWHYVNTTKDGWVISNMAGLDIPTLHKVSQSDLWIKAIRFWDKHWAADNTELTGHRFWGEVKRVGVVNTFKAAERVWERVFDPVSTLDVRDNELWGDLLSLGLDKTNGDEVLPREVDDHTET